MVPLSKGPSLMKELKEKKLLIYFQAEQVKFSKNPVQ